MIGIATADRRPNLHYDLVNPRTGISYTCPHMGWRYDKRTMDILINEDRILWPRRLSGRPRRKAFLSELESDYTGFSSVIGDGVFTGDGTSDIASLFEEKVIDFPKLPQLIRQLIKQGSWQKSIALHFFTGSGTTWHAAWMKNFMDGGERRYILSQLPEPLSTESSEQKNAGNYCIRIRKPCNIAEHTKERLRRAAAKGKSENPSYAGDLGFRVFKLDTTNIRAWDPKPDDLEGAVLPGLDHIEPSRTGQDIINELLLKFGLDLCLPIETKTIAEKSVHPVGAGTLIVCLDDAIFRDDVEPLALGIADWYDALSPAGESSAVFLDSAFAVDISKTNLAETLKQRGLGNVRSL